MSDITLTYEQARAIAIYLEAYADELEHNPDPDAEATDLARATAARKLAHTVADLAGCPDALIGRVP